MMEDMLDNYLRDLNIRNYSILISNPLDTPLIVSNMPHEWEMEFLEGKFHLFSEIVSRVKDKITLLAWDASEIESPELQKLSEKYNIQNGVSFLIKIKHESIIFTLYFDDENYQFMDFYKKEKHKIMYDILEIFENHYEPRVTLRLTNREIETLNFLKIGKTYAEISMILGISERTVRFHIKNILEKFDASSVRYAIFKASSSGII